MDAQEAAHASNDGHVGEDGDGFLDGGFARRVGCQDDFCAWNVVAEHDAFFLDDTGQTDAAVALVLAGALMGGEITLAVQEVRQKGVLVVSLNMAGSAPTAADLVVSDPVQAGVMTVMAVAKTAAFDISRQRGRVY